jgi:hypothetical protein
VDDTSLVTLCKVFGTTNLETFCRYLRNAYKGAVLVVFCARKDARVALSPCVGRELRVFITLLV